MPTDILHFERSVPAEIGGGELAKIITSRQFVLPIAIHLGKAVVIATKRDALALAHALTDAVLSLPKGV